MKVSHAAHFLNSSQRQNIGIQAIRGDTPIARVAKHHGVSRKFVYQQKEKTLEDISKAFEKQTSNDKVLFYIPVTKQWLFQVVLALIFICRASYQGVCEFFRDILDYPISKGGIHNIVHEHLERAKKINGEQDLSRVQEGLHDEIYQCGNPVLVGCCARSTYCYLLSLEDVLSIYQLKGIPSTSSKRWQKDNILRSRLGKKFYWVDALVLDFGLNDDPLQSASLRLVLSTSL